LQAILAEFRSVVTSWRFWSLFGFHDAQLPMHRTRFGLLFYTFQSLLRVTVIFLVLGPAVAANHHDYFGYLSIGMPLFAFYSAAVTSGYGILTRNKIILSNGNVTYLACVMRFMTEHSVRFAFSILGFAGYLAVYPETFNAAMLLLLPGILIAVVFIFATALTFMVVSSFLPNISEAVNSIMGIMFFATPLLWYAGELGEMRSLIAMINPFTHLIAVIREPALGRVPEALSYIYACSFTLLVVAVSIWLFGVTRRWMIFKV
jgi:lipopolysaccharide transport system permease protein